MGDEIKDEYATHASSLSPMPQSRTLDATKEMSR